MFYAYTIPASVHHCWKINFYNEENFIGKPYSEVESLFKSIDDLIQINDCGFISHKFGIGIYAPFAEDEPNEPVEGVSIFANGYYD